MKKIITIILLLLVGCKVSQFAQLEKDFQKEKPTLWKYNKEKNLYSSPLSKTSTDLIIWEKYKEYLTGKDTTFISQQFGTPNYIDKKKKTYKYFFSNDCDLAVGIRHQTLPNYNCWLIDFTFDDNYKLTKIISKEISVQSEE
jgi:hypothetical protein